MQLTLLVSPMTVPTAKDKKTIHQIVNTSVIYNYLLKHVLKFLYNI